MYPPQTSLIPATIAVARFIEVNGVGGFDKIYPYWYLGIPTRYLYGPIIPLLLSTLKSILPIFSYFEWSFILIGISFVVSSLLWGSFVFLLSKNKLLAYLTVVCFYLLPFRFLSSIILGETSFVIAMNLIPLALISVYKMLSKPKTPYLRAISILSLSFLLLVNFAIGTDLLVVLVILAVSQTYKSDAKTLQNIGIQIKRVIIALILAILLVTFWYGLDFWRVIISNPSVGGDPLIKSILKIIGFLRNMLPVILAILVIKFKRGIRSKLELFLLTYMGSFLAITLFRFTANSRFWTDWTSVFPEIESGFVVILALIFYAIMVEKKYKFTYWALVIFTISSISTSVFYGKIGHPKLISNDIPEGVRSLKPLWGLSSGNRVFLSGSTVFWANALYDMPQLRGGIDQIITNNNILTMEYEVREGTSSQITQNTLKKVGIYYVLVHTDKSLEYYHDYKEIYKWKKVGRVIWEKNGDTIISLDK